MRLRISHSTTYTFDPPVSGLIQVMRLTPSNHDGQYVASWRVDTSADARLNMHRDAFGNITHVLTHGPLPQLVIDVSGTVDTQDTGGILKGAEERFPPGLFLRSTPLTESDAGLAALARELRADNNEPLDFCHALLLRLHREMTFDTDPTHPGTTAADAFKLKRGVCQDYAHIFVACARSAGVPARYISGHFRRTDGIVEQEAGHAWAEAHVEGLGWVGFDPANGISTTDCHVRVALGLDYLGAAPIRGTRYGGAKETLSVAIRVDQASRQSQS